MTCYMIHPSIASPVWSDQRPVRGEWFLTAIKKKLEWMKIKLLTLSQEQQCPCCSMPTAVCVTNIEKLEWMQHQTAHFISGKVCLWWTRALWNSFACCLGTSEHNPGFLFPIHFPPLFYCLLLFVVSTVFLHYWLRNLHFFPWPSSANTITRSHNVTTWGWLVKHRRIEPVWWCPQF